VPCTTLRENTERPVTITEGTNRPVHVTAYDILKAYREIRAGCAVGSKVPKFWDGNAANRIAEIIAHVQYVFSLEKRHF
jgi:UDP-N-acetylglucosamine 2-epimerase (non-hydrolysing)